MNKLAKLFKTTDTKTDVKATLDKQDSEIKDDELTYFDSGYGDAKNAHGNSHILKSCLENNYQKFKAWCRENEEIQEKYKRPHRDRKIQLESDLEKRVLLSNLKEEEIQGIDSDIHKIDNIIADVQVNPDSYGIETSKKPKAQFYIGILVLMPITLYLLVFYISASFSAFFKQIESTELSAAIFDAQAYQKALEEGWLEAVFVCTLPFVFMGLGYLIHMFQQAKSKMWQVKLFVLFSVTFIFDAILAYQIEKKIYDFNKTLDSPDFNVQIAIQEVEFWGIIFAGFVVYVIWGLVFDFIMKEYEGLDKIRSFIKAKIQESGILKNKKSELKDLVNSLKEEISAIKADIKKEQQTIDGFIFPNRKYLNRHHEYLKGWMLAVSQEIALPNKEKDLLVHHCHEVSEAHMEKHEVHNEDSELVSYQRDLTNRASA